MRSIILFNMVSLDGYFEGPNHDIYWHNVDEEFNQFAIEQTGSAGGLIFGRVTYEMMAAYWPGADALQDDPVVAGQMNSIPKIVFSQTLQQASWQNTRLVRENAEDEICRLKQQPGRDWFIFGSARLSASLIQAGLIDEYRLILNPLALGGGTPLFQGLHQPLHFNLLKTRVFQNGNVLLYYRPVPLSGN